MGAGATTFPLVEGRHRVEPGEGEQLARRVSRRIMVAQFVAGGWGAVDVFLLLWFVLPSPAHPGFSTARSSSPTRSPSRCSCRSPPPRAAARKLSWRPVEAWLTEGREPTERERSMTLCHPIVCAGVDAVGWAAGAAVFAVINLQYGGTWRSTSARRS
jgi:hypothetical protein